MTTLEAPATVESPAVLVELDPAQVAQHPDNLRDPGRDIKALTASIAEVGVLVPLIVVPVELVPGHEFDPGITHVAVDGNRRQAAARAAGLPLPCLVRPDLATARNAARTMAVTGLARDGLTPTEEAHAVAVLFDLNMSSAAIGRAIGRDKTHIAAARKAATLTHEAAQLAENYNLTLVDMATIAEWQDTPGAVETLTAAAAQGQLAHRVAVLAIQERERQAVAACRAELDTAGVTVLDEQPRGYGADPARDLSRLRAADAPAGQAITIAEHADCPGHAAYIDTDEVWAEPGENTDADDDEDNELPQGITTVARYVCLDPARYRHLGLWAVAPAATGNNGDTGPGGDETGDEAIARQADAQARARETARVQRAELIRLNKEADAAQTVRRTFLRESLTVKSRAKAMAAWALERVILRDPVYGGWAGNPWHRSSVLVEILGENPGQVAADTAPSRHGLILWAHVVTAYEEAFNRDAHRQTDRSRAVYLQHLRSIGYDLADVEQRSIDNAAPDPLPGPDAVAPV